jgi:hypothetical protein
LLRVGTLVFLVVATALVTAGCGGTDHEATGGSDRLVALSSVAPVADAFNDDKGRPRLLLLLSPT